MKRPDFLYWEDYFTMDCMEELRKRKQTVEQADWREIEGKVVAGLLLMDGANVKDAAEILYEKGIGAALDQATPPDGQTAGGKTLHPHPGPPFAHPKGKSPVSGDVILSCYGASIPG